MGVRNTITGGERSRFVSDVEIARAICLRLRFDLSCSRAVVLCAGHKICIVGP